MLTLAMPQSEPPAAKKASAVRMLSVKIALDSPWGTPLWMVSASSIVSYSSKIEDGGEGFLAYDVALGGHFDDGGFHKLGAEVGAGIAPYQDFPPFADGLVEGALPGGNGRCC